jgi:hypothetical protein
MKGRKESNTTGRGRRKESSVRDYSIKTVTISDLEYRNTVYDEDDAITEVKELKKLFKYVRRVKGSYRGKENFKIYVGN